jgi:hypothetical protein
MSTIDSQQAEPFTDSHAAEEPAPPLQQMVKQPPLNETPSHFPMGSVIPPGRLTRWYDKIEEFVSRLSVRDNFWHRICALIWLPYAFFSGIKMNAINADTFAAVLPFRRFNRNWYRAMAGGALLANSEIAGGMYVFGLCGGNYTVVCKHLEYTFLRPCFGPAVYKMKPRENLAELLKTANEFNVTLDLEILQQVANPGERDKRVGRCEATFHVTPKQLAKARKARKKLMQGK